MSSRWKKFDGSSKLKGFFLLAPLVVWILVFAGSVEASPLGLVKRNPDIFATSLDASYNSTTNILTVVGAAGNYQPIPGGGGPFNITGTRPYNLSITVDEFGVASAGTLSISGNVNTDGVPGNEYSGVLLTGNLDIDGPHFGFADPGSSSYDIFEAVWKISGGSMQDLFGGMGGKVGTILDANFYANGLQNFAGSWNSDWNNLNNAGTANTGLGQSDNFAIPAPAAFPAGIILLSLFALLRRRHARRLSSHP